MTRNDSSHSILQGGMGFEGRLPASAPLANPYVPFQLENPPKYDPRKSLVRGTLFPGLELPFMGMVNQKELPVTPKTELQVMGFAIQGVGFTTVAMTAGVMELIGRAGVAILLVPIFGYSAAVWANPVAWILADAFLFPCYFTVMKWLRNRLLLTGQATQSPKEYAANSKSVN